MTSHASSGALGCASSGASSGVLGGALGAARYSLVIPAYNEEAAIESTLAGVEKALGRGWEVLVVDDGSTDSTAEIAEEFARACERKGEGKPRLRVLRHKENLGKGAAVATGLKNASSPYVALIDADGQHDARDVEKLTRLLVEGGCDLVIGNRFHGNDGSLEIPFARRAANWVVRKIVSLRCSVSDPLSGIRVLRKKKFSGALRERGFGVELEILGCALSRSLRVAEAPVRVRYLQGRKSKTSAFNGALVFLKLLSTAFGIVLRA